MLAPEANLALCSIAVSPERLAGAVTAIVWERSLTLSPEETRHMMGFIVPSFDATLIIINLWLQALPSLAQWKQSWLPLLRVISGNCRWERGGLGSEFTFPSRAARRWCLSVSGSSSLLSSGALRSWVLPVSRVVT